SGISAVLAWRHEGQRNQLDFAAGARWLRLDRIHGQSSAGSRPAPARHHESHCAGRSRHSGGARAAGKERRASHRRAEARTRWQVATEPVRPGSNAHRIHGIRTKRKTLLLRIYRASPQAMTRIRKALTQTRKSARALDRSSAGPTGTLLLPWLGGKSRF